MRLYQNKKLIFVHQPGKSQLLRCRRSVYVSMWVCVGIDERTHTVKLSDGRKNTESLALFVSPSVGVVISAVLVNCVGNN